MPPTWAWLMLSYRLYGLSEYGYRVSLGPRTTLAVARRGYIVPWDEHYDTIWIVSRLFPDNFRPWSRERRADLERWEKGKQVWIAPDWDEIQQATAAALLSAFGSNYGVTRESIIAELSQKECK
jgi:hypothetical protein